MHWNNRKVWDCYQFKLLTLLKLMICNAFWEISHDTCMEHASGKSQFEGQCSPPFPQESGRPSLKCEYAKCRGGCSEAGARGVWRLSLTVVSDWVRGGSAVAASRFDCYFSVYVSKMVLSERSIWCIENLKNRLAYFFLEAMLCSATKNMKMVIRYLCPHLWLFLDDAEEVTRRNTMAW